MRISRLPLMLGIAFAATALLTAHADPPQLQPKLPHVDEIGFCKPYNWLFGGWVAPPRIPLLCDLNGDGYADFVYATPLDKSIDVSLIGKGWKPVRGTRLISGLPEDIRAICAGHFGGKWLDFVVLGSNGGLQKALSMGDRAYVTSTVGTITTAAGRAWIFGGTVVSKNNDDIVVVDSVGHVQVVNAEGAKLADYKLGVPVTDAAAGDIIGGKKLDLAVRSGGSVSLYRLEKKANKIATLKAPVGQEALAVGDINADGKADVLVDGKVFLAPDFKRNVDVPGWSKFTKPVIAMMADVERHGRSRCGYPARGARLFREHRGRLRPLYHVFPKRPGLGLRRSLERRRGAHRERSP